MLKQRISPVLNKGCAKRDPACAREGVGSQKPWVCFQLSGGKMRWQRDRADGGSRNKRGAPQRNLWADGKKTQRGFCRREVFFSAGVTQTEKKVIMVGTNLSFGRTDVDDLGRCSHRLPPMANRHRGEQSWAVGVPEEDGAGGMGRPWGSLDHTIIQRSRASAQQEFGLKEPRIPPPRGLGQSRSVGRTQCTARQGGRPAQRETSSGGT